MTTRKTQPTESSVTKFLESVKTDKRRSDAKIIIRMMKTVSGNNAKMWGPSIIGFGSHNYTLASGKSESICKIGFSPRSQALAFYLGSFEGRAELLKRLGKHKVSAGGCLYINKLDDIDLQILEDMFTRAYSHVGKGGC